MKKVFLLLLLTGFSLASTQAQLKYHSNGKLTFGTTALPISSYSTHFEGWGHYLSYGNKFMEIVLGSASPRIAGTADEIVFYNSETLTFNSLQAANISTASDRSLKTNIVPLNGSLQTVMSLKPVSFDWKNQGNGIATLNEADRRRGLGFIAQDVEEILPQLVSVGPDDKKLLNYIGIIPILTKSIQELNAEVEALKAEVDRLKKEVRQ